MKELLWSTAGNTKGSSVESCKVVSTLQIFLCDFREAVEFLAFQFPTAELDIDIDLFLTTLSHQMDMDLFMTSFQSTRSPSASAVRAVLILHSLSILRRETPNLCQNWEFRVLENQPLPFTGSIRQLLDSWRDVENTSSSTSSEVQIQVLVPLVDTIESLSLLVDLHRNFSEAVLASRRKDNQRGSSIIEDYSVVNAFAALGRDDVTSSAEKRLHDTEEILLYFKSVQEIPNNLL